MADFEEATDAAEAALNGLDAPLDPEAPTESEPVDTKAADSWEETIGTVIDGATEQLQKLDPCWELKPKERDSLAKAWAPVVAEATGASPLTPLQEALAKTVVAVLPRTITTVKNIREARKSEALSGPTGEREELANEGGSGQDEWPADPVGPE